MKLLKIKIKETLAITAAALFFLFGLVLLFASSRLPNKSQIVKAATVVCGGADAKNFECFDSFYANLTDTKGPKAALDDLASRQQSNDFLQTYCHQLTHSIGREATVKYPSVSDAYLQGNAMCWSGYYHGVMEGIVAKYGGAELPQQINTACTGIPGKENYSFDYYNCVHGLGHGLMSYTDDDLFQSLSLCKKLTGSWEQQTCSGGIFMENIIHDQVTHNTRFLKKDDLLYPCDAVDNYFIDQCYATQSSYILDGLSRDYPAAFDLCNKYANSGKQSCFEGLGRAATGGDVTDVDGATKVCVALKTLEERQDCASGAAINFMAEHHDDTLAEQFCNGLTEQKVRQNCLTESSQFYSHLQ